MAKKTRRSSGARLSEAQLYRPTLGAPVAAKAVAAAPAAHVPTDEQLAQEYRYVTTDLKRIGVLALAMLVLLIVLAFVIV